MVDFDRLLNAPCITTFSKPVTFRPRKGGVYTMQGVFDKDYLIISNTDDGPISTSGPGIGMRMSDFKIKPAKGDVMVVDNIRYEIAEVKPDSEGMVEIRLLEKD